ncbi:MAG TPA: penicillin-binding protein 2 [Coriobacteriia bacterium]
MTTFRQLLHGRFATLAVVVLVVLGTLAARLWSIQVISASGFTTAAEANRIREVSLPAARGRILDVKNRPLVTNRPVMAVTAQAAAAQDTTLVARLSTAIGVPTDEILKRLASYKQARLAPRVLKVDVPIQTASYLVEHSSEFPGVTVEESAVREYPGGSLAAHVLGYTGEISEVQLNAASTPDVQIGDVVGKSGVESFYDKVLQGEKGFRRFEVDNQGRVRTVLAEGAPRAGKDIRLTIDRDVQAVAEKSLLDALAEAHRQGFTKAHAGAAVVLDVKTGAVVAMASVPTYDPSIFLGGVTPAAWAQLNDKASEYPLNNRAIMAAYPPASTFKAVIAAAGLQTGVITPSTIFNCPGFWTGMGKQWGKWCWDHSGHGDVALARAIGQSCDSYFYEVGKRFYEAKGEKLQAFARSMGLGSTLGIDLSGEVSGRVPDAAWKKAYNKNYPEYQQWLPGDTVNMAIGQGDLLLTPLQLASAYAALGNGGVVVRPHVLDSVLAQDGSVSVETTPQVVSDPHLSAANLSVLRSALVGVTTTGTGRGAFRGFPVSVAGKTGTAQVAGKDDYALFACYAPASAPRYAIVVVIEQGGHGGSVAAPAARQIMSKLFAVPYKVVHTTDISR